MRLFSERITLPQVEPLFLSFSDLLVSGVRFSHQHIVNFNTLVHKRCESCKFTGHLCSYRAPSIGASLPLHRTQGSLQIVAHGLRCWSTQGYSLRFSFLITFDSTNQLNNVLGRAGNSGIKYNPSLYLYTHCFQGKVCVSRKVQFNTFCFSLERNHSIHVACTQYDSNFNYSLLRSELFRKYITQWNRVMYLTLNLASIINFFSEIK